MSTVNKNATANSKTDSYIHVWVEEPSETNSRSRNNNNNNNNNNNKQQQHNNNTTTTTTIQCF
jgi:hypothetical protein